MKSKVISLRVSENLVYLAKLCSQEQRTDQATTMRQWLYQSAEEYALKLVEEGRISAGRAAELLDMSIWDIYRIAVARGIEIGATAEQYQESKKYSARLNPRPTKT